MKSITNLDFYRANESQIRTCMKRFETGLLPTAEQAVMDAGLTVREYPKEGYYHETPQLGAYFDCLRTLQSFGSEKVTPAIQRLHDIYTHPVFGLKQGMPTTINPSDVMYPREKKVTVSPVADPMTLVTHDSTDPWTIDGIMHSMQSVPMGKCLVGLGVLVDEKERRGLYNPVATCLARETTVLSAMKGVLRGMAPKVDWRVDKAVEEYARDVIDGYGELTEMKLQPVTPENVSAYLDQAESPIRCVNIAIDERVMPPQFYHWATTFDGDSLQVVDFFRDRVVTTKDWLKEKRPN
jgi:hypothetical protein